MPGERLRTCRGCRTRLAVSLLLRVQAGGGTPAGFGGWGRSQGRGLYFCPRLACAERALRTPGGGRRGTEESRRLAWAALGQARAGLNAAIDRRTEGLRRRLLLAVPGDLPGADERLRVWFELRDRVAAELETLERGAARTQEVGPCRLQ
jgi:hypothetical protein